jgi:acyl dehydratase
MAIDLSRLGIWSEDAGCRVEAARVAAYAAATNDDHPPHATGQVAPPLFAAVPIGAPLAAAVGQILSDDVRPFGVHAEQDMRFHRVLTAGTVVHTRAAAVGVRPRPSGTALVLQTQTRDDQGHLLNEQYVTLFLRGVRHTGNAGQGPPEHRAPAGLRGQPPLASIAYPVDADQTFRYAEASGDHSRIHLDADYARSVGLPGIIVHGMCTMAMTSRAVVQVACAGDSRRLKRLAVAFARPVLPGQTITVRLWPTGRPAGLARYVFDALNPAGKAVIQDGFAEIAD